MKKKTFSLKCLPYYKTLKLKPIHNKNSSLARKQNFLEEYIYYQTSKSRNNEKELTSYSQTTKSSSYYKKKQPMNHKDCFNRLITKLIQEEEKGNQKSSYAQFKPTYNNIHSSIKEEDYNEDQTLSSKINNGIQAPKCRSITNLNKKLMNSFTYQGEDEIKYSMQNLKAFSQFLQRKKAQKADMINNHFLEMKHGSNYTFTSAAEQKIYDPNAVLNMMKDNKSIMRKNLNDNAKDFAQKLMNINTKRQTKTSNTHEKINSCLLEKKIKVLKLMQKRTIKETQLDKQRRFISKLSIGENEHTRSFLYHSLVPSFLSNKFKQHTVTKFIGIDGKYFGAPV